MQEQYIMTQCRKVTIFGSGFTFPRVAETCNPSKFLTVMSLKDIKLFYFPNFLLITQLNAIFSLSLRVTFNNYFANYSSVTFFYMFSSFSVFVYGGTSDFLAIHYLQLRSNIHPIKMNMIVIITTISCTQILKVSTKILPLNMS